MEITRRSFVSTALTTAVVAQPALAALGGVLLPRMASGASSGVNAKLRIGLIGCGGRGTGAAVQALRADPDLVLVAMGDVFKDRLDASLAGITEEMGERAAATVQVPSEKRFIGFDSYQKVIDAGVDVVLICGYPGFRPMQLEAAIKAGKHVFAEKPLAVDGPGIRSVLASTKLAKEKNLALLVGFCWRHNPGMKAAFEQVLGGTIGEVANVHTTYLTSTLSKRPRQPGWSDMEFQMRNWWHHVWISGDHIVEQAVHSIDRLAWAMGDLTPTKVICLGGRAARTGVESGDSYDHFAATYEYADGRRAQHTTRQIDHCPSDNSDYIYGTRGRCTINGWAPLYECRDYKGAVLWKGTGSAEEASKMYQFEHDALFASIRAGKPINDGERSANSCLMAIMARTAAFTGQTVTWEQAMNSTEALVPASLSMNAPAPVVQVAVPGRKPGAAAPAVGSPEMPFAGRRG
jgi:predicted dehydrogenase